MTIYIVSLAFSKIFEVEADSEEEARNKALSGNLDPIEETFDGENHIKEKEE